MEEAGVGRCLSPAHIGDIVTSPLQGTHTIHTYSMGYSMGYLHQLTLMHIFWTVGGK